MPDAAPPAAAHKPAGAGMFLALIPWVLFTLVAQHGTLKLAAIVACAASVAVCAFSARGGRRPKLIELAAVGTFVVFIVVAFVAGPSLSHWLTRYARAVASAVLAVIVLGSLLTVPFTEEYARESVPRQYWSSPHFIDLNRRLTLMWAGVFAVMTVSHVVAGAVDRPVTNIVCNWVIPIVLILQAAKRSHGAAAPVPAAVG